MCGFAYLTSLDVPLLRMTVTKNSISLHNLRCESLIEVTGKTIILWGVTVCSLMDIY
jgi:hypothetical protein